MTLKRYVLIFALFLTSFLSATSTKLLTSTDVKKIMAQLCDYHIDHKSVSKKVIERSLKIYITEFDSTHAYLLQQETALYLNPSEQLLKKVMQDYESDKFDTYFTLNEIICQSIDRARSWRAEWESNPRALIEEAKQVKEQKSEDSSYSNSIAELKLRHHQRLLRYVSFLIEELDYVEKEGMPEKLVNLCEKQLRDFENNYTGLSASGKSISLKEQEHQTIQRTLKALAHSLDAHTAYFSPEEAYAMKVQLEKGMCGIGVVLREGIDGVVIHDLLKGGPAERSGEITVGDRIVEVDGKSIKTVSFRQVLEIMRGKEGSRTTLGIYKSHLGEVKRVHLIRSKIAIDEQRVEYSTEPFADGIIGKISLKSFYEGADGISSEQDLRRAISELQELGPLYGVVLDMRNNSGGFLSQAIKVTGLFISNGVVVISKFSDGSLKYYRTVDGKRLFDGPLVVLVSKGSASATEIVAQALQDYGVAVVVGDEKTYGKGTIQHQTVTDDASNSFFKVTIGRYYTVSGKSTQIHGVKSDIVVPTELHFVDIGENYLEYPLPADSVSAAYDDQLTDVDPFAKRWFDKHYIPHLQQKSAKWIEHLPVLQENSQYRIKKNQNFQVFLGEIQQKKLRGQQSLWGKNDLQLEESVNILKDMIFLAN